MTKNVKMALIVGGSLALIGLGYFVWKKYYKKSDEPKSPEEVKAEIEEIEQEQVVENKVDQAKLESSEPYKELKKEIDKTYDLYKNEDFEMCGTDTITIVNCKTNGAFSEGLTQGVWIQTIRRLKKAEATFNTSEKDAGVKEVGNKLVAKVTQDTNKVFNPKFYNTNTSWYADYIKRGGTPIPA